MNRKSSLFRYIFKLKTRKKNSKPDKNTLAKMKTKKTVRV